MSGTIPAPVRPIFWRAQVNDAADDAVLIRRCRQGDSAAFDALVQKYQDSLFNGIYRMMGDYDDAADAAQDVFLKAFRSLGGFRGGSSFYTWLYAIAVNTCISRRRSQTARKQHLHVPLPGGADDGRDDPPDPDPQPPDVARSREESARVEEAVANLPAEFRVVVVLKDIEGCSYAEIARMLGCTQGTVKSRLFRARERLREALAAGDRTRKL